MKVECDCTNNKIVVQLIITYEQVLWGALAAVWQKERQLATSLEFDYLHQKKSMQNADWQDDISNDVITLGLCFNMFFLFLFIFVLVLASH